jgi:hypothetical protein
MDEAFDKDLFINGIIWQRATAHNMKTKGYIRCNDYILFYSKYSDYVFNEQCVTYSDAQLKRYKKDNNGKLYKAENLTFSTINSSRQFEWRGTKPPPNRSWGASLEQLEKWWAEGRILAKKDGSPRMDGLKIFLRAETLCLQIGQMSNELVTRPQKGQIIPLKSQKHCLNG